MPTAPNLYQLGTGTAKWRLRDEVSYGQEGVTS